MKNNENKKNKKGLLILLLLFVAIISGTFAVTFSLYSNTVTGKTTAGIATWNVTLDNNSTNIANYTGQFNLRSCDWTNEAGTTVTSGMIAPGSSCHLPIVVHNNSDVDIDVSAVVGDILIEGVVVSDIDLTATLDASSVATPIESGEDRTIYVDVAWALGNDAESIATDTARGAQSAANEFDFDEVTLTVNLTASQHIN